MKNTLEMIESYKQAIYGILNIEQNIQAETSIENRNSNSTNIKTILIKATNIDNNKSFEIKITPMIWPLSKLCDKLYIKISTINDQNQILNWFEKYDDEGNRIVIQIQDVIRVIKKLLAD